MNRFIQSENRWIYNGGCDYGCEFHRGKVEFHHPIEEESCGLNLCEAHHSLIQGRKQRYPGESIVDKSLDQMRVEIKALEERAVRLAGFNPMAINKH